MPDKVKKLSEAFKALVKKHNDEDLLNMVVESKRNYEHNLNNFQSSTKFAKRILKSDDERIKRLIPSELNTKQRINKVFKDRANYHWLEPELALHSYERPAGKIEYSQHFRAPGINIPKTISEGATKVRTAKEYMKEYMTEARRRKLKIPED